MKPIFEKRIPPHGASFVRWAARSDQFAFNWHYHKEFELTYIIKSAGTRYVGDDISPYENRDFVLLGADLPHTWKSASNDKKRLHEALVIQFSSIVAEPGILSLPEMHRIRRLLCASSRGIALRVTRGRRNAMERIIHSDGLRSILDLLRLLDDLGSDSDLKYLASAGYGPALDWRNDARFRAVESFLRDSFKTDLCLDQAAKIANLSRSAFSRFFKQMAKQSFQEYVTELRIGHACEMLTGSHKSITEIAYASGYENLSNFNRRFLRQKGMTPSEFREALHSSSA